MSNDAKVLTEEEQLQAMMEEESASDDGHLTFTISEATYKLLKEVADEASTHRNGTDSLDYWVNILIQRAAKVQLKLWEDRTDGTILKRAKAGDTQSTLALLATLGYKGDKAKEALKLLGKHV